VNVPTLPPLTQEALMAHPEVRLSSPLSCMCFPAERVADTKAPGGGDVLIMLKTPEIMVHVPCHAWIEFTDSPIPGEDKVAVIYARCAQGEYRVNVLSASNPELPQTPHVALDARQGELTMEVVMAITDSVKARHRAIHAALWQRQQLVRSSALVMPIQAGALASMSTAGRVKAARLASLSTRSLEVKRTSEAGRGGIRERVTVELVMPKTRGQCVVLKASEEIFPAFKERPRRELPALVTEELAHRCRPRVMQAVLASMAVAYRDGGIRLDDDGNLPDKFRTEVMRVMGMPSTTASKAQRDLVREAMHLVRHAEFHVKPASGKRSTFAPLLVVKEFIDAPGAGERRAACVAPNDELMGSMAEGKRLRIPEALFQIGDDDREGVRTLAGLQLAFRLAMGTGKHEKLELFLRRAGLWEWCMREVRNHGMPHVMRELRRELDALRSLPHPGHAPVDIAGGTVIEGEAIGKAIVAYRDAPPWARSSD
jgi:hypothetical protein